MDLNKPQDALTSQEQKAVAEHLARAKPYGKPRKVWVEDGNVFVEGHDGEIVSMTPEVAINLGRLLGAAGTDSLINRVIDNGSRDEK